MTDHPVARSTNRITQQQHSYFFPSSAGLPPNGPRMLNLREVVTTFSEHRSELKAAEREQVARRTQEAVSSGASVSETARQVADIVTEVDGSLAAAHRVAIETVAQADPARSGAISAAVASRLDYAGQDTATLDTQA